MPCCAPQDATSVGGFRDSQLGPEGSFMVPIVSDFDGSNSVCHLPPQTLSRTSCAARVVCRVVVALAT